MQIVNKRNVNLVAYAQRMNKQHLKELLISHGAPKAPESKSKKAPPKSRGRQQEPV